MKRLTAIGLIFLVSILFLASSASAINIFFGPPSATNLAPGEQFTVDMFLDTEGETEITSVFVSAEVDPAVLEFVSGTSPGQILFNFSTFEGVGRVTQPFVLGSDPAGLVRAASFAALTPSGVASSDELLSTLTFEAVGAGSTPVFGLVAQGDDVTVSGVSVAGSVTFDPSATITVPEPSSVLLSLSALGTVFLVRRRATTAAV